MMNLKKFLINPILALLARVSFENLQKFGETHLIYLTVQNGGGEYTTSIAATILVQEALFGEITNVELQRALQKTQTESVNLIIAAFEKRNSKLNNYLKATGVDETPLYQSFFPHGVQEFTKDVTKGNVKNLMERMVLVITANTAAAGGAAVLTEYETFETDYVATRGLQITKKGEVQMGMGTREAAEKAWADQLFDNLLLIAKLNKNKPDVIDEFFEQSIVNRDNKTVHNYKLAANEILWVKPDNLFPGGKMIVTKKAGPNLRMFESTVKDVLQGDMQEDNVTTPLNIYYDNFNVADAKWIAFQNLSNTDELEFKVVFEGND